MRCFVSKAFLAAVAVAWLSVGCIRFEDDPVADASVTSIFDASDARDASEEGDASFFEGGADALPPPVCRRFDPSITQTIAEDMVSTLLVDCRLRRYFTALPPVRLAHFEECFGAQLASVFGCVRPDGTRYKYPSFDSTGQFCHDMQTGHASMSTSDGDFDAFVDDLRVVLASHGLSDDEAARVTKVFGAVRADVVRKKDAGPTMACDEADASRGGADASDGGGAKGSDGGPTMFDGGVDASNGGDASESGASATDDDAGDATPG